MPTDKKRGNIAQFPSQTSAQNIEQTPGQMLPIGALQLAINAVVDSYFSTEPFLQSLADTLPVAKAQDGIAYIFLAHRDSTFAFPVSSRTARRLCHKLAAKVGIVLRKIDDQAAIEFLRGHAEDSCLVREVWVRIAPLRNGFEYNLGDRENHRVLVEPGKVTIIDTNSPSCFYNPPTAAPMPLPAEQGDVLLLARYLNVSALDQKLLIAWITYTLAHPKCATTKYVHLVILGEQGSSKSLLSRLLQLLIDPSVLGPQSFPGNAKDLAISARSAALLVFDNMRKFTPAMSDDLCKCSTGAVIAPRALYTDADQNILNLHCPLILNGINNSVREPDLAQRCYPVRTLPLTGALRRSEAELFAEFENERARIFRGLLDLAAAILAQLPHAQVTHPERMIDFTKWLAAYELVEGVPVGTYQEAYSNALREAQLDSLTENLLANAVYELAQHHVSSPWKGTPTELLSALSTLIPQGSKSSKEWPQTPMSLSKRLSGLKASFLSQGIQVDATRGKERIITISMLSSRE